MNDVADYEGRTVSITCNPVRVRVGDYFPAEFEITNAVVVLEVPLKPEFFYNHKDLFANTSNPPEMTIECFRWCYNQLRSIFTTDLAEEFSDKSDETDLNTEEWK